MNVFWALKTWVEIESNTCHRRQYTNSTLSPPIDRFYNIVKITMGDVCVFVVFFLYSKPTQTKPSPPPSPTQISHFSFIYRFVLHPLTNPPSSWTYKCCKLNMNTKQTMFNCILANTKYKINVKKMHKFVCVLKLSSQV